MLKHCQHKLSFSKESWYNSAMRTFLHYNENMLTPKTWKYHNRSISSLTCAIKSVSDNDMQTTSVTPSPLPLIEPLQPVKPKLDMNGIVMLERYRQCTGYRRYDGHRCERYVKTDPSSPITDQVVCFNHDNSKKHKNGKKKAINKAADKKIRENRASDETIGFLLQQYSPSLLKKTPNNPQKLYDCWDCKYTQRKLHRFR